MKPTSMIRRGLLTLVLGLAAGCAAMDQDARINFLEGQMKDVLQKSAQWDVTSKDVRTRVADFGAQMDALREEMQQLSGEIEEMRSGSRPVENPIFSQRGLSEQIRSLSDRLRVLEARVEELERASGKSGLDTPASVEPGGATPPVPAVPPPSQPAAPPDRQAYDEAMAVMQKHQYDKAIRLFRDFIKKYRGHELSDNAQYWIGESYYAQKKYEEAIIEFEEVVQQYPKGDKVPAALLKEGLAFHELKDDTPARQILKKLVDQYPGTEEARLAEEKLRGL